MPETRPRTPGPTPPSPSFTSHQLREARAEAASLAAKNERLTAALTAARERIVELGAQLDAVTAPPVILGLLTASHAFFLKRRMVKFLQVCEFPFHFLKTRKHSYLLSSMLWI